MYCVYKYMKNKFNAQINTLEKELIAAKSQLNTNSIKLSFTECNEMVDYIIDDIWKNKYFLNYRLRELTIIPSMDDEITLFTKEIIDSISPNTMVEILKYYSYEYLIKKITRKAQMLLIDYTNTYKPSTK